MGYLDTTEVKVKLNKMQDIIDRVGHSIRKCKTNNGAVILGDDLESEILNFIEGIHNGPKQK